MLNKIFRVYQVLEEDGHKERISKELVMLQHLLDSEEYHVFKNNKDGNTTEVLVTRKKSEIHKSSSRQNSDSENYEREQLEISGDSDESDW